MCMLVTQLCLTLCDPIDYTPPGSSVHRILQARILEWFAIPFSRESSWPRDGTCFCCVSWIGRYIHYHWTSWEAICDLRYVIKSHWIGTEHMATLYINWGVVSLWLVQFIQHLFLCWSWSKYLLRNEQS